MNCSDAINDIIAQADTDLTQHNYFAGYNFSLTRYFNIETPWGPGNMDHVHGTLKFLKGAPPNDTLMALVTTYPVWTQPFGAMFSFMALESGKVWFNYASSPGMAKLVDVDCFRYKEFLILWGHEELQPGPYSIDLPVNELLSIGRFEYSAEVLSLLKELPSS